MLGQAIYNYRCYFCHGYSGDAKTLASSYLNPQPVSFIEKKLSDYTVEYMETVVREGKANTAMMSFSSLLNDKEISAVVYFVRKAFIQQKSQNTKYHTEENGWINHAQYQSAYPFALGEIALDTSWVELNESQKQGKTLFLSSCISCHDRANVKKEGVIWESFPISWPRNGVTPQNIDAISGATPYSIHNQTGDYQPSTEEQKNGEVLFQKHCTFCHGKDGTGKNWIGQFIQPHPRNFQQQSIRKTFTRQILRERIENGVQGSSMPAWRYVLSEQQLDDLVEYLWDRFK